MRPNAENTIARIYRLIDKASCYRSYPGFIVCGEAIPNRAQIRIFNNRRGLIIRRRFNFDISGCAYSVFEIRELSKLSPDLADFETLWQWRVVFTQFKLIS